METRIQLCGALTARIRGARIEDGLPGRQGRLLFAFLVLERRRPVDRNELEGMLWGELRPAAADSALSALLSKLRRVVEVEGRSAVRIVLPSDAWVDVEAATAALHRAESAVARSDWTGGWGPARVAQHVCERPFLPGEPADWAADRRRGLGSILVRSLELAGLCAARIGGSELDTAERAARRLVDVAPLRESGTRLLMDVLEQRGNRAEALLEYERLRLRLRDELGVGPSEETVELHRRLLGVESSDL